MGHLAGKGIVPFRCEDTMSGPAEQEENSRKAANEWQVALFSLRLCAFA
jgi:hypothetical protein